MVEIPTKENSPSYVNTVSVEAPKTPEQIEEERHLRNEEVDWGDDSFEMEEFAKLNNKKMILVEKVLNRWEKATNSYRIMDFECLRAEFPEIDIEAEGSEIVITIPKKLMRHLPSPSTYFRCRQLLNAEGKCLPTDENVSIRRKRKNRVTRRYFGKQKGLEQMNNIQHSKTEVQDNGSEQGDQQTSEESRTNPQ